ncbi:RraA family protein [Oceanobacillus polygoni]|uniref:Putative 4-hydroxy-4-methyl-2-oxoglutarate aldolase n=1 Tax=Oceanobacillus polygoni TaxID=1235259 RepID=A0A9X0YRT7_9BACI|nr:RraA family protein [Oceanobacillus polygoni]MBP2076911.1 RraA family protein [Oceanobacillus polygoni]
MTQWRETPQLLSTEITERAKKLNSSLLADAMNGANTMSYEIQPVNKDLIMVGTAVTVSMKPGDNLYLHQAIYQGQPGYVLIADGKGHTKNAYLGELMAGAAKAIGLEGIVIDGLVRDRIDLEKLDFPIYSKGFVPNGPYKDGPGNYNIPVSCGGISVQPGDLVVGDADGVVVVPRHEIESVFEKAEEKHAYEQLRLQEIAAYKEGDNDNGKGIEPAWLAEKIKAL